MILSRLRVNKLVKDLRWYSKNYYEILEVSRNATSKEIKAAFKKLSKELHPDKHPNNPNSHSEFVKLNEAYSVLSKLEAREMYEYKLNQEYLSQSKNSVNKVPQETWLGEAYWKAHYRVKVKEDKNYLIHPVIAIILIAVILRIYFVFCVFSNKPRDRSKRSRQYTKQIKSL